jgi:glutathionylspermidine synthase
MQRLAVAPNPEWPARAGEIGYAAARDEAGASCWCEDAAYCFSAAQIDHLDEAAQRLEDMCLELVDEAVTRGSYESFGLSETACALVEESWRRQDKNLYSRFDFAWDGRNAPKLLDCCADTPTELYEASVVQWEWLHNYCSHCDQFNGIHETLIEAWRNFGLWGHRVHFACPRDVAGDLGTVDYLRDTALQAGLDTGRLFIDELRWNGKRFTDLVAKPITVLFKLYPWQMLLQEGFAARLRPSGMRLIEPAWKMLLSGGTLLPMLWQRWPDHENLLPAVFDAATGAPPGTRRQAATLPHFDGFYPVLGVWVVASRPCGLGIRETRNPAGMRADRFVPHLFE